MNNMKRILPQVENLDDLIEAAIHARIGAYAPYSHYQVGAALLSADGTIFTGCNIENASYGAVNCAERTAFFKAVSEGVQTFKAIAICGGAEGKEAVEYAYPCGICRQVMQEFCGPDFQIIVVKNAKIYQIMTLDELLPYGFKEASMKGL